MAGSCRDGQSKDLSSEVTADEDQLNEPVYLERFKNEDGFDDDDDE